MTDDEYEQIKQEIGWHATSHDLAFLLILITAIWVLVAIS